MIRLLLLTSTMVAAGCTSSYRGTINFNPTEPLRIAVAPFGQVNEKGAFIKEDGSLLIDQVSVVSKDLKASPAKLMQDIVQAELNQASLDVITPAIVEAELVHNGFDAAGGGVEVDVEKVFRTAPSEICSKLLSCDAVLYGKVTRWDRDYYAIQSVSTIGLDLKLISARDGKVLFESSAEDSESRGLTKGPTGFSNLVLEPIKGLDSEIIAGLAKNMISSMLAPLRIQERPEFLKSAPPAILASAHDARGGLFPRKGRLTVVALGSPQQTASFSLGTAIGSLPMVEKDPGHYIGFYYPIDGDVVQNAKVVVAFRDQFGRITEQTIGKTAVTLQ